MRLLLLLLLVVALAAAVVWLTGAKPVVRPGAVKTIGKSTPVVVQVTGANGVRWFRARLEQAGVSQTLVEEATSAARWKFWRLRRREREYRFLAGRDRLPALKDGPARLVLEASSDDWRSSTTAVALDITVRTTPPALRVDQEERSIQQGGSGLLVFTTDAPHSGVRLGAYEFRSWPVAGAAPNLRLALIAFPYELSPATTPLVWARDEAGNEAAATFPLRVASRKFRQRDLVLTPEFLEQVMNQFPPRTGDLLGDFLRINRQLRQQNNQRLSQLRVQTEPRLLWSKPFRQMVDSKVEARFADHRRYFHQGVKVDEQDHLGFDLAATANAAVRAANDGKVVFAGWLGIYGNCVVIDHGCALQSIYGHLSAVAVKPGQQVSQGEPIGRTGATGLAGGDHLHFSMQVDGVQVNPVEWWDPRWLRDRIWSKLPAGAAAAGVAAP